MLYPRANPEPKRRRVVVTGLGLVTPLGIGWHANAQGFKAGLNPAGPVRLFDVSRQRCKIAAQADLPTAHRSPGMSVRQYQRCDRAARMLLLAAEEAWAQAGWTPAAGIPLILGTTSGGMMLGEHFLRQTMTHPGRRVGQPSRVVHYNAQRQALNVLDALGFEGPITVISNACASGANALGHAFHQVRDGHAARILAGGFDALCELTFAGFDSLQALSLSCCRPFDASRDGLTLGEGAAILAVEELESAARRGAPIHAEILGYGSSTDTHHLTQPHPEGKAALIAMEEACKDAGISPGQIDYINAHGTATVQNDHAEAAAISAFAGKRVTSLHVSSTKASTGHQLGAAGAVEAALLTLLLKEQWLPPQTNLGFIDPSVRFQIPRAPCQATIRLALSNSFGFGGANASLVLREWL